MNQKVIFVFFDTNIFLHFKSISEIKWSEIFSNSIINYVIAPCILKELDEQKYKGVSKKERNRAKNTLEKFYKTFDQDEGKLGNIKINFIPVEPSKEIFEVHKLSETNIDDRLLASIIEFRSNTSTVCLITDDLGLIVKAKNLGIDVNRLNEEYRIDDELDEDEKMIGKLQKENLKLKERRPNLKLIFRNEKDFIECKLNMPINLSNYISEEQKRIKNKYLPKTVEEENKRFPSPKINDFFSTPLSKLYFTQEYKKDDIDDYNKKLSNYYSEYEKYLHKDVSFLKFQETIINLEIYLYNFGNVSGKNVRINMHFPDGFEILKKHEIVSQPKKPEPPKLRSPFSFLDIFSTKDLINPHIFQSLTVPNLASQINNPPNISGINIKKTKSYDVDLNVRNCPHKHKEKILSLYLKFPNFDEAKSFKIDYKLIADDIEDFERGNLNVKIVKD